MVKKLLIIITFLILLGSVLFCKKYYRILFTKGTALNIYNTKNENVNFSSSTELYINTRFNYSFDYKAGSDIFLEEMDNSLKSESANISLSLPGATGVFSVMVMPLLIKNLDNKENLDYNKIVKLDIGSFSEEMYNRELGIKNPNFPNRKVSGIKKDIFLDKEAYSFEITDAPPDLFGGKDYKYFYLDNNSNKIIIKYPLKEKGYINILNSFKFNLP